MRNYLLSLILALVLVLTGCADTSNETNQNANNTAPAEEQQENQLSTSIKLTKEGEEVISEDTFEFKEGESLMEVMERNFEVTFVDGYEGQMIKGLNGIGDNEEGNYYWHINVNDESLMVGAHDYTLEENDKVHFDYQSY
ncbi:DUF4430 domain-containing protein [Sutcliffiella horikoshii]|uniref:DUF4430 domain-containing protein n=1 Tax=Sutcliffiella horikoshii TaxID=79883 RepID=UPI0020415B1A|nr:DUF4430 domain-containing protein [Sutcliffiella horikoshii]MCM3617416.1 DUF4430 domain-containing protein [Sutcliffiella horikoshii]